LRFVVLFVGGLPFRECCAPAEIDGLATGSAESKAADGSFMLAMSFYFLKEWRCTFKLILLSVTENVIRHYLGDVVAKSKISSYLDTHAEGPEERSRQLERITERLDALVAVGAFHHASAEKAKLIFAERLKVPTKTVR